MQIKSCKTEPITDIGPLNLKLLFSIYFLQLGGGGYYSTIRKVVGSSPGEIIGLFSLPNPSSRTMTLGLTQPLTEMNTTNFLGR
jgi:hypothetical protein